MTTRRPQPYKEFVYDQRAHVDIGALAQRVTGTESALKDVQTSLVGLRADMTTANNALTESLRVQLSEISRTIQDQQTETSRNIREQQDSYYKARSTNWTAFYTAAAAVIGVLISLGAFALNPINATLNDVKQQLEHYSTTLVRRDDFASFKDDMNKALDASRRRSDQISAQFGDVATTQQLAEYEKRIDDRDKAEQENGVRVVLDLDGRIKAIDGQLIKRPEINDLIGALQARLESLARNQEDLRRDFGANYTIGDQVKSLESRMEHLSAEIASMNRDVGNAAGSK